MAKITETSAPTYASHLRMIAWACTIFVICPLRCSVQDVRRITATCSSACTQRGWMSTWAMAHMAGPPWPGDEDIVRRGVRTGTLKLHTPQLPRNWLGRRMVVRLLCNAAIDQKWWWGCIIVIAYNFISRMPSELFSQFARPLLQRDGHRFTYGPNWRKHRLNWCSGTAFCSCETCPEICLHKWIPILDSSRCLGSQRLGGYKPATWTAEMRARMLTDRSRRC